MTVYQENAEDLSDAAEVDRRKFEVGQRLRYRGPSDDTPPRFQPGDVLTVEPRNGCGMGIDTRRDDGVLDMVWPWEVGVEES